MSDARLPEDEGDLTAAELALGLLDGEERAAALRRQLADPGFAAEVEDWRDHFTTMFAAWPEADPSPRVEQRLFGAADGAGGAERRWKWLAGGSSALAAGLAAILLMSPDVRAPGGAPQAPVAGVEMVAAFAPEKGAPMPARYDAASARLMIGGDMPLPADHSAQLWAIDAAGRPHALGVLRQVGPGQLVADATDKAIAPGTLLVISLEPAGGSPTGAPTGPELARATLTRI